MRAFVIMPFDDEYETIYDNFISEILDDMGFNHQKANDIKNQQNILKDIVEGISNSDLIIADLTEPNPNVYYELGLAHALNRPVILLTQSISELPFDLQSYRVIEYDVHFSRIDAAKDELRDLLEKVKNKSISFSNPVSDFAGKKIINEISNSTNEIEKEDLGLIDHIIEIENSFEDLSDLALDLTDSTDRISKKMHDATGKFERATADNANQAAAIRIKRISQSLAEDFDDYSSSIAETNPKYQRVNDKIKSSLDFIFNFIDKEGEGYDKKTLKKTKEDLTQMESSLVYAKDEFKGFIQVLEDMPELQVDLKKSIQKTINEQNDFVSNMDQTLSTLSRTIRLIDKILSKA